MIRFFCECGQQLFAWETHVGLPMTCAACKRSSLVPAVDTMGMTMVLPAMPPLDEKPPPKPTPENDGGG